MALKAYKHLTDGEVKIVEEGSAEETSLLADTVTGSSYLQLTSTGHSQEIAAAQGTALWVDVTDDLGGGSSFAHLSEDLTNGYVFVETSGSFFGVMVGAAIDYSGAYTEVDAGTIAIGAQNTAGPALTVGTFSDFAHLIVLGSGECQFGDGTGATDTTLKRAAAGVMEIAETGGGLRLHSPNGAAHTLTVSNAGALVIS
jgi:hypothetical protein